jgi:hypothetical protein
MPLIGSSASQSGRIPGTATITGVTAGNGQVTVAFNEPAYKGKGAVTYTVTSSPSGISATGSSSPIIVTGLSNGTSYTFTVTATTSYGVTGPASAASNSITPAVQGQPDRAVFMGGVSSTYFASNAISNIDYLSITLYIL